MGGCSVYLGWCLTHNKFSQNGETCDPFYGMVGAIVSITDEQGNEIGRGKLESDGTICGELNDGTPYEKKIDRLTIGED